MESNIIYANKNLFITRCLIFYILWLLSRKSRIIAEEQIYQYIENGMVNFCILAGLVGQRSLRMHLMQVISFYGYDKLFMKVFHLQKDARISVINRDGNWWYGKLDGKVSNVSPKVNLRAYTFRALVAIYHCVLGRKMRKLVKACIYCDPSEACSISL